MSLSSLLTGTPEVRGGLTADLEGRVLKATPGPREETERTAAAAAAVVNAFTAAGSTMGFSRLALFLVKGPSRTTITAVRPHVFLLVTVDADKGTTEIEKALLAWTPEVASASPPTASSPEATRAPSAPSAKPTAPAGTKSAHPASAPAQPGQAEPWVVLRRALIRGQLTEASARHRDLYATKQTGNARPGSEPVEPAECERIMQVLLEGIGGILAGDALGGGRTLSELTATSQSNLTFRWVAYHWSALAALKSGNMTSARSLVKEALTIARQIDMEAHAVSQWTAAEVLAHAGDPARALAWVNEARGRFERLGDRWGLGQTWFAEARIRATAQREHEAVEAARMALAVNPGWDEPATFLARRALMRNDLAAAEEILQRLETPAADRVRALIEAIRQGTVTQTDASEFLKEQDAAPNPEAIRILERIANASPNFVQVREALAWMLLKVGRYADAEAIFRGLLAQTLSPPDRASVMLGLGCIAHTQQPGTMQEKQLRAVMDASKNPSPTDAVSGGSALPALGSSVLTVNGNAQAVFSGQLSGFALPDLLEFLRGARRTGLLACSSTAGMAALRFRDGWITSAAAPGTPDLGQLLMTAGKISATALRSVAARQGSDPQAHLLGEMLVREGLVDAAAVQEALKRQIELSVREVIGWKDGEFAFNRDEKEKPPTSEIPVSVDPQVVLLEVFKEQDEASRGSPVDVEI